MAKNKFPSLVYKYRSGVGDYLEDELQQALEKQAAYFSLIENLNDPFEGNPTPEKRSPKEIRDWLRKFYSYPEHKDLTITGLPIVEIAEQRGLSRKKAKEFSSSSLLAAGHIQKSLLFHLSGWRKNVAVYSISEMPDSILMWSHYSNGHSGYCLEWVAIAIPGYGDLPAPAPVQYVQSRSTLSETDIMNLISWGRFRDKRFCDEAVAMSATSALVLEKAQEWKYESEWRYVDIKEPGDGYRKLANLKLARVILGAASSDALRNRIEAIVKQRVPVVKAVVSKRSYELEIPDCS